MKKHTWTLLLATMVVSLGAISCEKEETEFEKGKKDGKAMCDCVKALPETATEEDFMSCMAKVDLSKVAADQDGEYAKGVEEGGKACAGALE